jgi:hypothetical protein
MRDSAVKLNGGCVICVELVAVFGPTFAPDPDLPARPDQPMRALHVVHVAVLEHRVDSGTAGAEQLD